MRAAIRVAVLAIVALSVGGSVPPAAACMECQPAFVIHDSWGYSCVITTIDYDCQACVVVPDPCDATGHIQRVWHRTL